MSNAPSVDGHYTYIHARRSDGRVFYVGKGSGKRAWSLDGRSPRWRRVADRHGLDVTVCAKWASESDAFSHERLLIDSFRHMGHPLVNATDGGEGVSGFKRSPEQLEAMSQARRAFAQTERGKAAAAKAGKKVAELMASESFKARAVAPLLRWVSENPEAVRERMRAAQKAGWSGEHREARIRSMRDAEEATGRMSRRAKAMIQDPEFARRFHDGRDRHFSVQENRDEVGARIRAYYSDPENRVAHAERARSRMANPAVREAASRRSGCRPFVHEQTGAVYVSQGLASEATGISQSAISNVLRRKKQSVGGQVFTFVEEGNE